MVSLAEIEKRFVDRRIRIEPLAQDFVKVIDQLAAIRKVVFEARLSERFGGARGPTVTADMERSIKDQISPVAGMSADEMRLKMIDLQRKLEQEERAAVRGKSDAQINIIKGCVKIVIGVNQAIAGDVVAGVVSALSELPDIQKELPKALKDLKIDGVEFAEFADLAWTQHAAFKGNLLLKEIHRMGWSEADSAYLHHRFVNSNDWKQKDQGRSYDPVTYRMAVRLENAPEASLRQLNADLREVPLALRGAIGNGFAQRINELKEGGYPVESMTSAMLVSQGKRSQRGEFSLNRMFVEEALQLGDDAVLSGIAKAQDIVGAAYLERNIVQEMYRLVERRATEAAHGMPVTVLFDFDDYEKSVLKAVESADGKMADRSNGRDNVKLGDIEQELDLSSRILLKASMSKAGRSDTSYKESCLRGMKSALTLVRQIESEPAERQVSIEARGEATPGYFHQLAGEIRAELKKSKMLSNFGARIGARASSSSVVSPAPSAVDPGDERKLK